MENLVSLYPKLVTETGGGASILFLKDPLSVPCLFEVEAIAASVLKQNLPNPDPLREVGAELVAIERPGFGVDDLGRETTRMWAGLTKDSGDTPTVWRVDPNSLQPGKPSRRMRARVAEKEPTGV
jgi:hypothetical protein